MPNIIHVLKILIDTSTKRESRTSKYGTSTGVWAAWWNDITIPPVRVGIIYHQWEGPNKIYYISLLNAFASCCDLLISGNRNVEFYCDNELIINQLNGTWHVDKMREYYDKAIQWHCHYHSFCAEPPRYYYMSESNPVYSKIDIMSKWIRTSINQRFQSASQ